MGKLTPLMLFYKQDAYTGPSSVFNIRFKLFYFRV